MIFWLTRLRLTERVTLKLSCIYDGPGRERSETKGGKEGGLEGRPPLRSTYRHILSPASISVRRAQLDSPGGLEGKSDAERKIKKIRGRFSLFRALLGAPRSLAKNK